MIQCKIPASPVLDFLRRDSVPNELRVGVSSCLLGEKVRYDGGDRYHPFINDRLAQCVKLVPVCPEVEVGLGTPREPMDLVLEDDGIHLRGVDSQRDFTKVMKQYADAKAAELARLGLCGFVFKSKSPSCGLRSAVVRTLSSLRGRGGGEGRAEQNAGARRTGRGLFAAAVLSALPWLPVEEESRLRDVVHRERFLERVFALYRLRRFFGASWTLESLREFHANEAFLLLAQGGSASTGLDALLDRAGVPDGAPAPSVRLAEDYCRLFLEAMGILSGSESNPSDTRRRQAEALRRLVACVEGIVSTTELNDIWAIVEEFDRGTIDRAVPILRIREVAREHRLPGLAAQSFLQPYPEALTNGR